MTIDKLDSKVEKLIEQVRALTFEFKDHELESEADTAKEEAIAALENYQELAGKDWEERPQGDSSDEETEN